MTQEPQIEQPRQYGDEINIDAGLTPLSQAKTDEEAMAIEAILLIETDAIMDATVPTPEELL